MKARIIINNIYYARISCIAAIKQERSRKIKQRTQSSATHPVSPRLQLHLT